MSAALLVSAVVGVVVFGVGVVGALWILREEDGAPLISEREPAAPLPPKEPTDWVSYPDAR